ncbi:hypothetical protein [Actinomadura sp. SCN-SB]|uniref:hypothetical protein n=1 Tax=Actinomadura sp. SCN-SB TaxID=3373092 RepID=UPI003751124A
MTTLILVLLCLAIAGRELYLASDKRLPRAQAELRELRAQLGELARRHDALQAEVAQVTEHPGIVIPPRPEPPQPPPGALRAAETTMPEVVSRIDRLGARLARVEQELGSLSAELAGMGLDREARQALARSLDATEQVVAELRQEMLERLDRDEGVVSGLLLSEEGESEALLAEAYERCAAEYGLRVRTREERSDRSAGGGYLGTAYHLSGRRPDELADELFHNVRAMYDPRDPSALTALLVELAHLHGGGIARIGAFTVVRTAGTMLCGLLPEQDQEGIEPWEPAARIRELPADRQADLTWLGTPETA